MKQKLLDLAEVMDAHRVVPKIIVALVITGYGWFAVDSYEWIKEIYAATGVIPPSAAAYAGGTLAALGGVLMLVINKYFDGGRKW